MKKENRFKEPDGVDTEAAAAEEEGAKGGRGRDYGDGDDD